MQSQIPGQANSYNGVFDAARKISSEFGIRGIYQGLGATFMRNIPANAFYFLAYEGFRRSFTEPGKDPTMMLNFFAGGMAGVSYWATVWFKFNWVFYF